EDGHEFVQDTVDTFRRGSESRESHFGDVRECGSDEFALVREVVVEGAAGDLGRTCDLPDRGAGVAYFRDTAHGGGEDATTGLVAPGSHRSAQLRRSRRHDPSG